MNGRGKSCANRPIPAPRQHYMNAPLVAAATSLSVAAVRVADGAWRYDSAQLAAAADRIERAYIAVFEAAEDIAGLMRSPQ